eukprot:15531745-Heterocapsa_arctica.AAC.1
MDFQNPKFVARGYVSGHLYEDLAGQKVANHSSQQSPRTAACCRPGSRHRNVPGGTECMVLVWVGVSVAVARRPCVVVVVARRR